MKTLKIKLDNREVELAKLPIGKYAELLKAIKELPKHVKSLENKDSDSIIEMLPTLVGESLPDVIEILTIASPLKREEVEEMGLDEVTRVILGIVEVNNFKGVYKNLKKALALPAKITK